MYKAITIPTSSFFISLFLFSILFPSTAISFHSVGSDYDLSMTCYMPINLFESFEGSTFPPSGWTKVNVAFGATGWERRSLGESPVPGFSYGTITVPPGGGNFVAFCNWITGGNTANDQWLITPQLVNIQTYDSLNFWLRKFGPYIDHLDIKISTTTATPSAMTIPIAILNFSASDSGWVQRKYRFGNLVTPGSNVYIGFRQWVVNTSNQGSSFSLDLVQITSPVGVKNIDFDIPDAYILFQNYPNPFNPETKISYKIPKAGNVKLVVYNVLGNEVFVIVNTFQQEGFYTVDFEASHLPGGIYFYKLASRSFEDVKKMSLIK